MFSDSILLSCFCSEDQELDILDAHPVSIFSMIYINCEVVCYTQCIKPIMSIKYIFSCHNHSEYRRKDKLLDG